ARACACERGRARDILKGEFPFLFLDIITVVVRSKVVLTVSSTRPNHVIWDLNTPAFILPALWRSKLVIQAAGTTPWMPAYWNPYSVCALLVEIFGQPSVPAFRHQYRLVPC